LNATKFWAVVPAAGVGKRMGSNTPKQYLEINGKPVLEHTLERLLSVPSLSGIFVALGAEDGYWADLSSSKDSRVFVAPGGRERADSVLSALRSMDSVADPEDWVLVHDAARLCITREDIEKLIQTLAQDPIGGILALPVSDTLKTVQDLRILNTPDRSVIWRALTPQMFRYGLLRDALSSAQAEGRIVTDEASAIEQSGYQPRIVEGRPDNIKITRPEDLELAAFYLEKQCYA
jgi:2-C-methyl-D-erythritol 4-phosphate cytidylyltransferase